MKIFGCFCGFLFLLSIGCNTKYCIHVKTSPHDRYEIFLDKTPYGFTPEDGDTIIETEEFSVFKSPLFELKKDSLYGCFKLNITDSLAKKTNVTTRRIKGNKCIAYEAAFTFIQKKPETLTGRNMSMSRGYFRTPSHRVTSKSQIYYCYTEPPDELLKSKAIEDMETLESCISYHLKDVGLSWTPADSVFRRMNAVTISQYSNDTTIHPDSLSYAEREHALANNMEYIAVFYGFHRTCNQGVMGEDIAASAAITTAGCLLGLFTGFFIYSVPTGKSIETVDRVRCSLFSVQPNRCIFSTVATHRSVNKSDSYETLQALCEKLVNSIEPVFSIRD